VFCPNSYRLSFLSYGYKVNFVIFKVILGWWHGSIVKKKSALKKKKKNPLEKWFREK